ncbi:hypothetical protein AXG93_2752s1300 [Marchantia polymorpha subsp. ruderalis]|uniref:F-box domain-containing protein n=1 Tax=Marchantia polymorpha subsp. ruderalis TaxID=1480154 RepID=A0A176VW65_MARPO|nr:hypothetical protein AXG93_2752s1300 [Marchantia polymorpha subsp. ruderalis]
MEERSKESSALVLPKALPKTTMEWDSDEEASSSELAFMGRSLSEDLLLTVLSKLPLESLRRFRCVCRKWNDLLMSWEFSRSICHKPGKLIPLYPGDGELNLYDTSNRCWLQRDLKFGDDQGLLIEDQGYELVASGGGLLAFLAKPQLDANWRERFPTFIVSNPLTRQSHRERFPTFIVSNPLTRQYHRLPTSVVHGSRSLNIPEFANTRTFSVDKTSLKWTTTDQGKKLCSTGVCVGKKKCLAGFDVRKAREISDVEGCSNASRSNRYISIDKDVAEDWSSCVCRKVDGRIGIGSFDSLYQHQACAVNEKKHNYAMHHLGRAINLREVHDRRLYSTFGVKMKTLDKVVRQDL